jgi:hypothetical protein
MKGARVAGAIATAAALLALAVAAGWSWRVGWADYLARQETLEATERALRWTPSQAVYHFRLGVLTADKYPARSIAALQRAVALNPSDAASWIELGLRLERNGKADAAERCLLRAAEVDRQYLPRWTLANFYFRRNDTEKFWTWARSSAEMVYGDAAPLFRLCGQVLEDGRLIERLGIVRPEVRVDYLAYLLGHGRPEAIMPAVRKVMEQDRKEDVPVLLAACDRLLDERRVQEAVEVWNGLAQRRNIPSGTVDTEGGPILTNGAFAAAPSSHGFDWRLPATDGVSASGEENPTGLRLTFSGSQPENCEVLAQFLPVREKTSYELKFTYRTSGIGPGTGLRWRVMEASGGVLAEGDSLSSEEQKEDRISFRTPAGRRLARIALEYRRAAGTTRAAGFVALRHVDVRSVD